MQIANDITQTGYPEVVIIDNIQDVNIWTNRNLIIKRGYSDGGIDVKQGKSAPDMAVAQKRAIETVEHYNHESLHKYEVKPMWFGVPYIPEVREKGEIRCFFIGGRLSYMISTVPIPPQDARPGDMIVSEVMEITPLTHLSYVPIRQRLS
jgi:hypothetical protein